MLAGRLSGDGFAVSAAERPDRAGARGRARPGPGRRGGGELRRGRARARRHPARQPRHVPGRRAGRDGRATGCRRWPPTSPTPPPRPSILGYTWAKEAYGATLFATAVSDLPIYAVFADPAYRPLLTAVAAEVLAQAPVRPLPLDGFDPADLDGSLDRLAEFNRQSAKTHSGIYRDLAIRHRPTEVGAILGPLRRLPAAPDPRADRGDRAGRADLLPGEPGPAGRLRAAGPARPAAERGRVGGRRAAPRGAAGRWPASRSRSRTSSRSAGLPTRCGSPATDAGAGRRPTRSSSARLRDGGRRGVRHHPVPGVRGRLRASGHRRHPQPARSVAHLRRLIRRLGRPGRRGRLRPGHRHRYRRLDPDPGRLLRRRRAEADLRPRSRRWGVSICRRAAITPGR